MHLPHVRLRSWSVRFHRDHHPFALLTRVRGSPSPVRLVHRGAGDLSFPTDRVCPVEPWLHHPQQAQAPAVGQRRSGIRVGRSTNADSLWHAAAWFPTGGHHKPTTGEVIVDGKRVSKLPDNFSALFRRENIGFIFQKYNLIPTLSVQDNIIQPLIPTNPAQDEVKQKLERVMDKFNIHHKKTAIVRNLSGGEQQRVAIARAHINDPKIIIADEPTANLDEKLSLHFIQILKELKASNKTIIVATHDPLFFELDFVDRVIEVHNGNIVE